MQPPRVLLELLELELAEKAVLVLEEEVEQVVKKVPPFFFW